MDKSLLKALESAWVDECFHMKWRIIYDENGHVEHIPETTFYCPFCGTPTSFAVNINIEVTQIEREGYQERWTTTMVQEDRQQWQDRMKAHKWYE